MSQRIFILTICAWGLFSSVSAQPDHSRSRSPKATAVRGTSAVQYATATSAPSRSLTSGMIMTPMSMAPQPMQRRRTDAATQPSAPADASNHVTAIASDSTVYGPEGSMPTTEEALSYPVPMTYGYRYGGLHQGLNVSLNLSVFAAFGKNAPSGAGFSQSLTATYLQPLGKKAWMAVGGYVNHTNWSGNSHTSGGIYGQLGYRFNEHWAAYIYGRKSLVNNGLHAYGHPWHRGFYNVGNPMMYDQLGDKLGAAVRWTPSSNFSLEMSVEKNWYPTGGYRYEDRYQYNYPVPKP